MADGIYTRELSADVLSYILDIFERYGKPMGVCAAWMRALYGSPRCD